MAKGHPPNEAELSLIRQHAPDASAENVMVYHHLMVGDQIVPRRFLRLHPEQTLARFQIQTAQGLPWIFDHNYWNPVTLGRAFSAELVKEQATALVEVDAQLVEREVQATHLYGLYYMPLGVDLPDGAPYASTDKMGQAINLGLSRDTSIGFGLAKYECCLCKNDVRDWENCPHVPGGQYEWEAKPRLCIVDGIGGDIIEESSVFRGAYPIAGIQKQGAVPDTGGLEAVADADLKTLPMDVQAFHTFSVRGGLQTYVPAGTKRRSLETLSAAPGATGGDKPPEPTAPEALGSAAPPAPAPVVPPAADPPAVVPPAADPAPTGNAYATTVELGGRKFTIIVDEAGLADVPDSIDVCKLSSEAVAAQTATETAEAAARTAKEAADAAKLQAGTAEEALSAAGARLRTALGLTPEQDAVAEVERLSLDLADTRTYREHLVAEALAMGVRAHGNAFQSERWEEYLRAPGRTMADLQKQLAAFEAETGKRIPRERMSVPVDPPVDDPAPAPRDEHTYTIRPQAGN